MDDLERARAHLKQAEGARDGTDAALDTSIAQAYATIALADRLGPVIEHLMKPIRMTTPGSPQERMQRSTELLRTAMDERATVEQARDEGRERERQARLAMVDSVVLEGGVVVHPGDPGTPGYDPKDDPAVWSPQEQDFEDPTPGPVRSPGGIFGQMEERPNDLEDGAQH